jgi:hypothetical protein
MLAPRWQYAALSGFTSDVLKSNVDRCININQLIMFQVFVVHAACSTEHFNAAADSSTWVDPSTCAAAVCCTTAEAAGLPGRVGGGSSSRAKRQSSGCPPVAATAQQQQQQQVVANGSHAQQQNGNGAANGVHALMNGV